MTSDDVVAYLDGLPRPTREVMDRIRQIVLTVVPDATESLSYGMPTFSVDGRKVVHIAGWAKHVSIYPAPAAAELADELAPYLSGRGTLKFLLRDQVPYELVERVVRSLAGQPR